MKKLTALFCTIVLLLGIAIPASAAEVNVAEMNDDLELSSNVELLSVQVLPNEEAEALLLEEISSARNSDVPSVYAIPTTEIDLSEGDYDFDGTYSSTFHSKYLFTGHDGKLQFKIFENSENDGDFIFKVYKKGLINTTIYNAGVARDDNSTLTFKDLKTTDKFFFIVYPDGVPVEFAEGTRAIGKDILPDDVLP